MEYKCKNCGGNVIFDPEKQKMFCPHCSSLESQDIINHENSKCPNCGADLDATAKTTSSRCHYCDTYLVLDEHLKDNYRPDVVLPFQVSKNQATEILNKNFGKRIFVPDNFLSQKSLEAIQGIYVPYYLYDFNSHCHLDAVGIKDRTYRRGDYLITEHHHFNVLRDMDIPFNKVPADGSQELDDIKMSLIEPYDYQQLLAFDEKYLSGFFSNQADFLSDEVEAVAHHKADDFSKTILAQSVSGYTRLIKKDESIVLDMLNVDYTLLPMYIYKYAFKGETYEIFVNGQNGKVIGEIPISKSKAVLYFVLMVICLVALAILGLNLVEML